MTDRTQMLTLLQRIEVAMKDQSLWETVSPPPQAFASELPFCVDTMAFSQWLQWIFIARFRALLEGGHNLPDSCAIAVMAEEAFKEMDQAELIALLRKFDALFD